MPTKGEGAIGALDFPAEERKRLAKLLQADDEAETEKKPSKYAEQIAQLHMHSLESAPPASAAKDTKEAAKASADGSDNDREKPKASAAVATADSTTIESKPASTEAAPSTEPSSSTESANQASSAPALAAESVEPAAAAEEAQAPAVEERQPNVDTPIVVDNITQVRQSDSVDTFLHYLTVAIVVALFALIYKKLLQMHGVLQ
ncbi:unnamed protein product [Phytophthora fragariaefolia]|uniref:Unnamed protein product n=1 Tax=Phytophthora fragariaefolia TaxID=1490495 RepID=A0A9W7CT29_9STRA|nr:unnamed protein product [Phytophthora fragariaefolia]